MKIVFVLLSLCTTKPNNNTFINTLDSDVFTKAEKCLEEKEKENKRLTLNCAQHFIDCVKREVK